MLDIERTSGVAVPEDAPEVSDRALLERFDLVYVAVCTSQRELLTYVAATDTARFHERDGYPDHASWLAGRFGISHWAAHRWIHAAHALDKLPSMPYDEDRLFETDPDDIFETRCADALSLLASGGISDDSDADRATVVVHTQLGKDTGGEIEGGPILHPETVRRISCDSRLGFVLHDVKGEALGIGHTSRNIPRWLMRQLRYRDGGCTFPGCGRRVYLQGHHIWHWEDGGPTDLCNLVLVCGFHHKLLHEFGWKVWLHGSESHWYRPSGRPFDPGPDPPVHDPQPQPALVSF